MHFRSIVLSESSLIQKALHYFIYMTLWRRQKIGKEIRLVVAQSLGAGGRELSGMIQMFCILIVVGLV